MSEPVPMAAGKLVASSEEIELKFEKGVDLNAIRAALGKLKERRAGEAETAERVSTLNLVAVYFSVQAADRARAALEAIGSLHPSRLLVLIAEPKTPGDSVTARVSVVRQAGSVTLERVVLTAVGAAVRHLQPAMFGLLAPDLPVALIWGGRAEGTLFDPAVERADRVILDSGTRPVAQLRDVAELVAKGAPIGDLAWARIYPWQALAADTLDLPNLREHRANIQSAVVTCAGEVSAEGALLAGWFASRVKKAKVELVAGPADATGAIPNGQISSLTYVAPPATFTLRREKGILVAEVQGDDDGAVLHRVRLPPEAPGRLLGLELQLLAGYDDLYALSLREAARIAG